MKIICTYSEIVFLAALFFFYCILVQTITTCNSDKKNKQQKNHHLLPALTLLVTMCPVVLRCVLVALTSTSTTSFKNSTHLKLPHLLVNHRPLRVEKHTFATEWHFGFLNWFLSRKL